MKSATTPSAAFGFMLIAFFCFASMDTTAKWLVMAGIPALQVAFLRYLVHFLWVGVLYAPRHGWQLVRSPQPLLQTLRGLLLLGATALNFTALQYLPLPQTIAIFFATPMVVCLLSIPILGEQVGIRRFLAVGTGFIGVLVIVEPWGQTFDWHVLFAFGALLCASGYFVVARLSAGVDSNATTQFYTSSVAMLCLLPVALSVWQWPASELQWGLLVTIGSLGMLGHSLVTRAHHLAEASVLAPVVYSQIIYITFFSWLVFSEPPTASTALGTAIIAASGLYIWFRERHHTHDATLAIRESH